MFANDSYCTEDGGNSEKSVIRFRPLDESLDLKLTSFKPKSVEVIAKNAKFPTTPVSNTLLQTSSSTTE